MREAPIDTIAEVNPALRRNLGDAEFVSLVRMGDVKESDGITSSESVPFGKVKAGFTRFVEVMFSLQRLLRAWRTAKVYWQSV